VSVENAAVDDLETPIGSSSGQVSPGPGAEVVEDDDLITVIAQPVNEMRPDETGSASDKNPRAQAGASPASITMQQL
jgi:hypothetical protein